MVDLVGLNDLALIRHIQHGDEYAMEEFYHRFAPGLHAFIRRKVGDPRDIEDILAETMAAVVKSIMRFKGESCVFTWLCRIAQFKLSDYYRRQDRKELVSLEESSASTASPETDLENNLAVWQVLLHLNIEYRRVLEDKYFTGYSTREIAFRIGKSEKAVQSILVRARKAFAHEYQRISPEKEA